MVKKPILLKVTIFIALGVIAMCSQLSIVLAEQSADVKRTNTTTYYNSEPNPTEQATLLNYTYQLANDDNLNQNATTMEAVGEPGSIESKTLVFCFEGNNTVKITYNVLPEEVGNSGIRY